MKEALELTTYLENESVACGAVHSLWSMIQLNACATKITNVLPMDFIVLLDHSSSMVLDSKMAFVLATVEFFITELSPLHRFSLVQFNDTVEEITDGLEYMTPTNRKKLSTKLSKIQAAGSTNIGGAMHSAINILTNRPAEEQSRLAAVFLFTDGMANVGLRGPDMLTSLTKSLSLMPLNGGLIINTFGFGADHDSQALREISLCSHGGVYSYVESTECIGRTFSEALAGILSTVAANVKITIRGQDGCRITGFASKYPTRETTKVKNFEVSLGSLFAQESKSIMMRLSLRKFDQPLIQNLLEISMSYVNAVTGETTQLITMVTLNRPSTVSSSRGVPMELDKHLNRFTAATAIEEGQKLAGVGDLAGANQILSRAVQVIETSVSQSNQYCRDLVRDIYDCIAGLNKCDPKKMSEIIHYMNAYSSMYFLERSNGCCNLIGIENRLEQDANGACIDGRKIRMEKWSAGYGYITWTQEEVSEKAENSQHSLASRYLQACF